MPFSSNQVPGGVYQPWMRLPGQYEILLIFKAGGDLTGFGLSLNTGDYLIFDDVENLGAADAFDMADGVATTLQGLLPDASVWAVSGLTSESPAHVYIRFIAAEPITDTTPVVVESSGYYAAGDLEVIAPRPR